MQARSLLKRIAVSGTILLACFIQHASYAQSVQTFTSRQDWQTAVAAAWQFTPSLRGFTQDAYFQTSAQTIGPFTLQQIGQDPTFGRFRNFVDVPPLQFSDNAGAANAALYTKSNVTTVNLTFSTGVFAWGANFYGAQSNELVNLALTSTNGANFATVPVPIDTGFFGILVDASTGLKQISFKSQITNPDPSIGEGFSLDGIVGAYTASPSPAPLNQVVTTTSGLAYSRVTQTFNGTVAVKNISAATISGPFQVVFQSLPASVTLVNAAGLFNGSPYITINAGSLAAGQATSASIQFSNPSSAPLQAAPATYIGSL